MGAFGVKGYRAMVNRERTHFSDEGRATRRLTTNGRAASTLRRGNMINGEANGEVRATSGVGLRLDSNRTTRRYEGLRTASVIA